ncbi:MAG TPA: hypothetical protein VEQ42_12615, partial [Pyrinomonadaceae bacterium]|nr:hypothetical protein [Pyrinomonadaceae bacterium]
DGGPADPRAHADDVEGGFPSSNDSGDDGAGEPPDGGRAGRRRDAAPTRMMDALPGSPQLWSTVCVACLVVSAALILNGRVEAAFVTATLGVLAWFINVRNRLRDDDVSETNDGRRGEEDEKNSLRND